MMKDIKELEQSILKAIQQASTLEMLELLRVQQLGRKSPLNSLLRSLKDLPVDERIRYGQLLNDVRDHIVLEFERKQESLQQSHFSDRIAREKIDVTAPGKKPVYGHLHPLTLMRREIELIFRSMGFFVAEGPELESEWYNFDALNIRADHPSRDMQDTFWIKQEKVTDPRKHWVMRTQTSPVQVRYMETHQPPFRIIVPGRVFRNEATDATHEMQFYQFEGLMVTRDVSMADLKGILEYFLKRFFRRGIDIRFVPSYFPFTEPSVEVFARLNSNSNWLELAGAGIVHPNVFKSAGYAPNEYQGIAFGMTIDRLALLRYGIDDIRLLYASDMRFLKQF